MKEGHGDVLVIPRQPPVVAVSPGVAFLSPRPVGVHTPSPFSFSAASTRWSTASARPSIDIANLFLRAMVMVFSFGSSIALAAAKAANNINHQQDHKQSFQHYPVFVYNFVITTMTFVYSAYQLFKGICDITSTGLLISDKTSDYVNFIIDQLACYLLVSCSSVTIHLLLEENISLNKATIVSVCMSIVALLTTAACAVLSGYKLSKRIMW